MQEPWNPHGVQMRHLVARGWPRCCADPHALPTSEQLTIDLAASTAGARKNGHNSWSARRWVGKASSRATDGSRRTDRDPSHIDRPAVTLAGTLIAA
jgi:hypothetical protein